MPVEDQVLALDGRSGATTSGSTTPISRTEAVVSYSLPNDFEVRRVQAEQSMGFVK